MPDKKQRDAELIAVSRCYAYEECPDCDNCSHYDYCTNKRCITDAYDLINRLQAENERLNDILDKKVVEFAYDKKQEIKAEAYKEFAERLNKEFHEYRKQYKEVANFDGASAMLIAKRGVEIVSKELVGE